MNERLEKPVPIPAWHLAIGSLLIVAITFALLFWCVRPFVCPVCGQTETIRTLDETDGIRLNRVWLKCDNCGWTNVDE